MKTILLLIFICILNVSYAQNVSQLDTIYYDKNWKGVSNPVFADFYRIIDLSDTLNAQKKYRDYYISGELQSEGGYISINPYDDSKSIFDGDCTNYYKSGQIKMSGKRIQGKLTGEYTTYYENGLIHQHAYFNNGELHGLYSEFSEDGNTCTQIEYSNGKSIDDTYTISDSENHITVFSSIDNKPIWISPSIEELKNEYQDGVNWLYYNKNGVVIVATNTILRDYGKYYQIKLVISNNTIMPIEFNPDSITSTLTHKKKGDIPLIVYSSEDYMKKVKRQQNFSIAMNALAEGMAAVNAGYSTSSTTTTSTNNGYANTSGNAYAWGSNGTYASANFSGDTSYSGSSSTTSTTTSYNGAAAYQAQVIASNRIASYENELLNERAIKNEGYLKRTTLYPGDVISGYINIGYKKGSKMEIVVNLYDAEYKFSWNTGK